MLKESMDYIRLVLDICDGENSVLIGRTFLFARLVYMYRTIQLLYVVFTNFTYLVLSDITIFSLWKV